MHRPPGRPAPHPRARRQRVPLLDPDVLAELEAEIPGAGARFASSFTGMWERRLARIEEALQEGDAEESLEAVRSLRVSAVMVGAPRLAAEAAALEDALRSGPAAAQLGRVRACGQRTAASLRRLCLRQAGAQEDGGDAAGANVSPGRCGAAPPAQEPLAAVQAPPPAREGRAGTL